MTKRNSKLIKYIKGWPPDVIGRSMGVKFKSSDRKGTSPTPPADPASPRGTWKRDKNTEKEREHKNTRERAVSVGLNDRADARSFWWCHQRGTAAAWCHQPLRERSLLIQTLYYRRAEVWLDVKKLFKIVSAHHLYATSRTAITWFTHSCEFGVRLLGHLTNNRWW